MFCLYQLVMRGGVTFLATVLSMSNSAFGDSTGACCLPDDSCEIRTETLCKNAGGTYHGDDTECYRGLCEPMYRVTDLGDIGFVPNADNDGVKHGTFGINNDGQIVYARDFDGETHAALWLPGSAYGLSAGIYDITDLSEDSELEPSIARDINIDGLIIGQEGSVSLAGSGKTALWTISSGSATITNPDGESWSRGMAINDADPAMYIGEYKITDGKCLSLWTSEECYEASGDYTVLRSFRQELSDPYSSTTELSYKTGTTYCHNSSHARDVSQYGQDDELIVGYSFMFAFTPDCLATPDPFKAAMTWEPEDFYTPTPLTLLSVNQGVTSRSEARGVNDNGEIVGYGPQLYLGWKRAYYWSSMSSGPTNLNLEDMPPDHGTTQATYAEAINNMTDPHIIATNDSTNTAMIWIQQSDNSWEAYDLHDLHHDLYTNEDISDCKVHKFRAGHDINDNGWIVAWGDDSNTSGIQPHAYLLTPETCPADVNDDGVVNIDDIFTVLGLWGECEEGVICEGDVDFNCTVDIDDNFVILGEWGDCPGEESFGGSGGENELLLNWLDAGGYAAILTNEITWYQVEQCFNGESYTEIEDCLNNLIE